MKQDRLSEKEDCELALERVNSPGRRGKPKPWGQMERETQGGITLMLSSKKSRSGDRGWRRPVSKLVRSVLWWWSGKGSVIPEDVQELKLTLPCGGVKEQ